MKGFEENEISIKANGGTELAKRRLAGMIDPTLLENFQIVCSRPRELDEDKIRIFWAHDMPQDPESAKFQNKTFLDSFHKFVFISNWQYQQYQLIHGLPYDNKSIILESGIDPAPNEVFSDKYHDGETIRLVYTSTPQRGLDILVPVFTKLAEIHKDIHLDVFSSFKIYGWGESDAQFEPLYEQIRNHPQMTYHGFVPNETLKDHLQNSHIFSYPCTWTETSCRAMLEAMSAGLLCVHPNAGALPETSGGLNLMYHGNHNKQDHANIFADTLNFAIQLVRKNDPQFVRSLMFNKAFVDRRFNINNIKQDWDLLLTRLLQQYPTVESRKKPGEFFTYKVTL